jgi:hypothetical protein
MFVIKFLTYIFVHVDAEKMKKPHDILALSTPWYILRVKTYEKKVNLCAQRAEKEKWENSIPLGVIG